MPRKFAFQIDTLTFNSIVSHETFQKKYERFTLKYKHDFDSRVSTAYFSEEAPEEEIMKWIKSEFNIGE